MRASPSARPTRGAQPVIWRNRRSSALIVADVDGAALGRKLLHLDAPAAIRLDHEARQLGQGKRRRAADIAGAPRHLGARGGEQKRLGHVIDISEVAALLPAPNLDRRALEEPAHPDAQKSLAGVLDAHARPIDVGEAQGQRAQAVEAVIEQMIGLARHLRHGVGIGRAERMIFADRQT